MPGEDDLFISASFDGSELITGFDGASSAIQESVSNITDSLEGLGTGMTEAGQGVANLVNQLTGVTSTTEQTTGQLSLFSDAILSSAPSAQEAAQALYEYELGVQALYDHLITLQPATQEAVQSVLQFDEALQVLMASSEGAGVALTEQAAATQEAGAALTGMDAALYEMSDAQLTATAAEQEYAESMNAVLSEMADVQLAQQEMTGSLSQYSLISNEAANKNAALTGALQTLSNELKGGVANLENIALAYQKVEQTAERANLQVQQTALGFRVLRDASGSARQEISQVDGLIGYLGGRMGATEAGVGSLGFAFGTLARVLAPLNALMVAAFPVISLILVVDIIDNIIDKFEKLDDTIRKTEVAENDLATGILRAGQSLQLENLRLEDQISKLEGGVSENLIAEALIESEQEAEKLGKAFEDDLASLIRLQEQGKVGVFYRIVEPEKAGTEQVGNDVKKKIEALQQAVSAQRVANAQLELDDNDATEKAKEEADQRVEIARTEAQKAIDAQKEKVQNLIAEDQKSRVTTATPRNAPREIQGLSKEDAEAKYQPAVNLLNAADLALKQNIIDEKLLDEISANRTTKASDAQDALNRARQRTVGEAQLKADEDALSQSLEKERNAANQRFKIVEDNEKLVVQQAIAHGEDRYKAEEDATKKVLAARQKLTSDLLIVEGDRYREESAIQKRREDLDTKTLVGDKLEAAEITNAEREKHLEAQKQIDIQKITADGIQSNLLLKAQEADAEEKIAQEKTRRAINELQRTYAEQRRLIDEEIKLDEQKLASKYKVEENKPKIEQSEITAFAKGGGGAVADVIELGQRKTVNEELLSIDRARTAEEISLSQQKEAELTAALKQEEQGYKTLYENGKVTAEAYAKFVADTERNLTEVKDTETAKRVLLQQKEIDQEIRLSQEAEKQEEQLEMQLSQGMARELDKMLFQTKSFHDAMTKLWQDLVRMIIEEILKMVSAWIVAHTIMEAVHKIFDKKVLTPGAGEEGVATTGRPKAEDVAAPSVSSVLGNADRTKEIAQTHELSAAKQQLSVNTKQVAVSEESVTSAMAAEQPTIIPLQTSIRGLGQAEQVAAEQTKELASSIGASAAANLSLEATNAALATSEVGAAAADAFAQHIIDTAGLDIPGAIALGAAVVTAGTPFITMASAAGGWDVPDTHSSYNTVIHPKEMVLDRPIAEGMRNIIARGMTSDDSSKGNTVFGGNVHFNYSPTVTGDMDPAKHGDAMFSFFQSKLQRMGVSIP